MSPLDRGDLGVLVFAIGGVIQSLGFAFVLQSVNKPNVDQLSLMLLVVLPVSLVAFLFMGAGLLYIVKSTRS